MAHFNFVISQNAKWGHTAVFTISIACWLLSRPNLRIVSKLTTDEVTYRYCTEASNQKSKYAYRKIGPILLQKKHWMHLMRTFIVTTRACQQVTSFRTVTVSVLSSSERVTTLDCRRSTVAVAIANNASPVHDFAVSTPRFILYW